MTRESPRDPGPRGQGQLDRLVAFILIIALASAAFLLTIDVTSTVNDSIETESGSEFDQARENSSDGLSTALSLSDSLFSILIFGAVLTALFVLRGTA